MYLCVFKDVNRFRFLLRSLLILQEADGLILINIDTGSITYSNDEDVDVPDIPLLAAQTFIQR